jgi:secreted trypsin-like serine protease
VPWIWVSGTSRNLAVDRGCDVKKANGGEQMRAGAGSAAWTLVGGHGRALDFVGTAKFKAASLSFLLFLLPGFSPDQTQTHVRDGVSPYFELTIQGGAAATPAIVAVTVYLANEEGRACSGTMIASDLVVTAAHCLPEDPKKRMLVVAAPKAFDGTQRELVRRGKRSFVAEFKRHPDYKVNTDRRGGKLADNDLALLRLKEPVANATIARLPDPRAQTPFVQVIVAGWGLKDSSERNIEAEVRPIRLLQTTAKITMVRDGPSGGKQFGIKGYSNVCRGDSGGPSFLEAGSNLMIVGVHSSSNGCEGYGEQLAESHDIYLPPYLDWIKQTARAMGSRANL